MAHPLAHPHALFAIRRHAKLGDRIDEGRHVSELEFGERASGLAVAEELVRLVPGALAHPVLRASNRE